MVEVLSIVLWTSTGVADTVGQEMEYSPISEKTLTGYPDHMLIVVWLPYDCAALKLKITSPYAL